MGSKPSDRCGNGSASALWRRNIRSLCGRSGLGNAAGTGRDPSWEKPTVEPTTVRAVCRSRGVAGSTSRLSTATFDIDPEQGLKTLAYEFAIDDMSEVLAGLRARHGPPLSTSLEERSLNEQIWVWNTGEDLITAVKQDEGGQPKFLTSYRPSRLRPGML